MTSESWQVIGNLASTAGVTTCAIGGANVILASYRTYASPYTSLTVAERKLEKVRSRLQVLSPKQREEIEIATRDGSSNQSSLEALEKGLEECVFWLTPSLFRIQVHTGVSSLTNMHCRLSKRIEETTFRERHFPYSQFRTKLSRFEEHAKALLNDTLVNSLILLRVVLRSMSHYTCCVSENNSAIRRWHRVWTRNFEAVYGKAIQFQANVLSRKFRTVYRKAIQCRVHVLSRKFEVGYERAIQFRVIRWLWNRPWIILWLRCRWYVSIFAYRSCLTDDLIRYPVSPYSMNMNMDCTYWNPESLLT